MSNEGLELELLSLLLVSEREKCCSGVIGMVAEEVMHLIRGISKKKRN